MQIFPVQTARDARRFLEVPVHLYANDPHWIRPLDKDIEEVFDPKKNKAYRFGKTIRWIMTDDNNNPIGRIAAFVNQKYKNKGDDFQAGGIGFFECINNQDAADLLFDNARHWLITEGMQAMDGPINFGERDKWWGLLTEGFKEPLYGMNYNPPFYIDLFTNYGFEPFYKQICFGFDLSQPLNQKILDKHAEVSKDPDIHAEHVKKNEIDKYGNDFATVYNKAWAGHGGMKEMAAAQAVKLFRKMKPVIDERLVWFVYHQQQPIAMFINLPDLNQWFKYLHGKFGLLQKLKFLWLKRFQPNKKFTGLVFGVVPEFQGKGIDKFMIAESAKMILNGLPYEQYEMQWIGDFNPKMLNIAQNLGAVEKTRELTTYRYQFDRSLPFKRHPIL
jgi:hypothetical protein